MKKLKHIQFILIWLCFISQAIGSNISELQKWVAQGNSFYEKSEYQNAVTAYEKALNGNYESAALYFNLANAHYKLKNIAPAIYNYEKALLLNPSDVDVQTNLKYAQRMTIDDIKEIPKVGFAQMIKSFVNIMHYDTWAWLAVISFFIMLGCFIGYYLGTSTTQKRIFFILFFVFIGLGAISFTSGFKNRDIVNKEVFAIVFTDVISVKSEPKNNADEAFTLHEGTKVAILESNHTWTKIQIADGKQGWLLDKDIKKLK